MKNFFELIYATRVTDNNYNYTNIYKNILNKILILLTINQFIILKNFKMQIVTICFVTIQFL